MNHPSTPWGQAKSNNIQHTTHTSDKNGMSGENIVITAHANESVNKDPVQIQSYLIKNLITSPQQLK